MSNHFHLLLEVPPMPVGGLGDEELLKRLQAIYSEAVVAGGGEGTGGREATAQAGDESMRVARNSCALHLPDARFERVHENAVAALHAVVQPDAPAQRAPCGRSASRA